MGFLNRLFGGGDKKSGDYVDKQGVYFFVQCDNCGTAVRVRADKQHDLQHSGDGYTWHKTIVDSRCFRPMQTVVQLNSMYEMTAHDISGGRYVTEAEYNILVASPPAAESSEATSEED